MFSYEFGDCFRYFSLEDLGAVASVLTMGNTVAVRGVFSILPNIYD